MKFAGKAYSGDAFVGHVHSNSMRGLTRRASTLCNRYSKPVDKVILHQVDGKEATLTLTRVNRLSPNNTVIRGRWQ